MTVLDDVAVFVRRYMALSDPQLYAIALWTAHTHAFEAAEQTPYLTVTSPKPQCGKSRLLEVLKDITPRAEMLVTPSEAVTFRLIEAVCPTMLLDEVDAIFALGRGDQYEGLRGIINSGHRAGATVPRCEGFNHQVKRYSAYCPKVLAGIGTMPATIVDRSIPIRLQRKAKDEQVERMRRREFEPAAAALKQSLEAWAGSRVDALTAAEPPEIPDELSDRMQDAWEPLLIIADDLGGPWPTRARDAAIALCTGDRVDAEESEGDRLLSDIRDAFDGCLTISTSDLLRQLNQMDDAPWRYRSKEGLTSFQLSRMLRAYGVRRSSGTVRLGKETAKGYKAEDFAEAWERYL